MIEGDNYRCTRDVLCPHLFMANIDDFRRAVPESVEVAMFATYYSSVATPKKAFEAAMQETITKLVGLRQRKKRTPTAIKRDVV